MSVEIVFFIKSKPFENILFDNLIKNLLNQVYDILNLSKIYLITFFKDFYIVSPWNSLIYVEKEENILISFFNVMNINDPINIIDIYNIVINGLNINFIKFSILF